jgi:transposase-like protein
VAERVLTPEQEQEIIGLYLEGRRTMKTLAKQYGISDSLVNKIIHRNDPVKLISDLVKKTVKLLERSPDPDETKRLAGPLKNSEPLRVAADLVDLLQDYNPQTRDYLLGLAYTVIEENKRLKIGERE